MTDNISFYSKNADELVRQYDSVTFESVHSDWLNIIPQKGIVLDVGAGSGRDSRYYAQKGLSVVAVEPATELLTQAKKNSSGYNIHWLNDRLPELKQVFALQVKFDLIVLSAVWMHIPKSDRERTYRKLSSLLKPGGKLVISLRHGECADERTMYEVSADEINQLASRFGLAYQLLTPEKQEDKLGRDGIVWQTVLSMLPDDGTGAFPLIRNIVMNDAKASTYKIALLRTLLRIAEGHPGAVIEQNDKHVVLPLGLLALYWLKLYKPLVDTYQMQQSGSSGLGFIKPNGWGKLTTLTSNHFYVGASYSEPVASQVYRALKDISTTIRDMPAKYITVPGSKDAIFTVETARTIFKRDSLILDYGFLASLGKFCVPVHIWNSFTRFSVWIEPALVNEWATLMASYRKNQNQAFSKMDYLNALQWEDPRRTTDRVRNRVDELLISEQVICCWSGKPVKAKNYAIDHAFPFARWPNNDLWNLLPSIVSVNLNKSDKLPTGSKLLNCRELIVHWWMQAWQDNKTEFFTQANLALPNLRPDNTSFDDAFEAFTLQRDRIKELQQLDDWG